MLGACLPCFSLTFVLIFCPQLLRVLHPAFEEDEVTLIFVGGVLGAIAGGLQVIIFYT